MKQIAYQAPVIKTLTMDFLMAATSGNGVTGVFEDDDKVGEGGIDDTGSLDPAAKTFGNRSVWDD